jgi:hypothetical protein
VEHLLALLSNVRQGCERFACDKHSSLFGPFVN